MRLIRIPLKIIALPLLLAVTAAKWVGSFLVGFARIIFYIFAGLCFLVAVLSYFMDICTGMEAVKILAVGFVIFLVPQVAVWLVSLLSLLSMALRNFIRS